jgi:hypothetical protein
LIKRKKNKAFVWILLSLTLLATVFVAQKTYNKYIYNHSQTSLTAAERTWLNYHKEVEKIGKKMDIAPEYLLALIALECSGNKEVPSRFEPHVFVKLQEVRDGELQNFESITAQDIANSSDESLKNLASSWGPFQLMGYQCLYLDIKLKDMRGKKAVYHGAQWIKNAYGKSLDKKRYKDAFHIHNTGKPYPKIGPPRTHSRYYVPRGIKFMKEFKLMLDKEAAQKSTTE